LTVFCPAVAKIIGMKPKNAESRLVSTADFVGRLVNMVGGIRSAIPPDSRVKPYQVTDV
jgi:hypothetical protein